jgi:hypothetical protein
MFDWIILAPTFLTTIIEWTGTVAIVLAVDARHRLVRGTGRVAITAFRKKFGSRGGNSHA